MQIPAKIRCAMSVFVLLLLQSVFAQPVSVTDYLGRQVELAAPAERIVSLMPSHSETVIALGAGQLLVGVDEASPEPAGGQLPRLGNGFSPNLELIVSLEPDLVLVDAFSGVHSQLAELGVLTFAGTPESLAEVADFNRKLGQLTGHDAQAAALNALHQATVEGMQERTRELDKPRVYVELDPTPFSAGPGSYIDDLLQVAGGANVVPAELGAWPMLSPEFVVASEPDIILLLGAPYGETEASFRGRPGFDGIGGRVVEVDSHVSDFLSRPGPGLAEALEWLFTVLHPDAAGE